MEGHMKTRKRENAWLSWLLLGVTLTVSAGACTREEADQAGERVREGAQRVYEKLPPKEEVRDKLKQAGKDTGEALRDLGHDVKKEAAATRDLIQERTRDTRDSDRR